MKKKIIFSYIILLVKTLIALITIPLYIIYFNNETYGYYNLIILYMSYLAVLHFGYNDAIQFKYRNMKLLDINKNTFIKEYLFSLIVQVTIGIVIYLVSNNEIFKLLSFLFVLNNSIRYILHFYIGIGAVIRANFLLLIEQIIIFTLILLNCMNITVETINIILLSQFSIMFLIVNIDLIFNNIKKMKNKRSEKIKYLNYYKTGIFILLGNLSLVFILTLDRFNLRNDYFILGEYSYIMIIVSSLTILLVPFRNIFYSQLNVNMKTKDLLKLNITINTLITVLIVAIGIILQFFFLDINNNYTKNLVFMLPLLYILIDATTIISDILKVQNYKKYFLTNFILLIINIILFLVYNLVTTEIKLFNYLIFIQITYFIILIVNSIALEKKKAVYHILNVMFFYLIYFSIIIFIYR